ncbi:MAG: tetratricopeptide repeat protein, partial [Cyclobacteriaceae bacterium]
MKKGFFILFCLILAVQSNAQKIKYKDLYVFLSGRQYREAEPLLKKYLKDNDDNPNAFMHMGYIYEAKFMAADVLKEPGQVALFGDSAAYYLDLANRNMTEKEIKKNDEFYQEHARRNPRTGDFGVSLSDVVNHLTEKSKEIRDRQQKIIKLNRYFVQATAVYERLQQQYKSLTAPFENQKQFYLRSDDKFLEGLDDLSARQDSVVIAFNSYKSVLTQMGKSSYNQTLQTLEIKDFRNDGHTPADFYADKVMLWDYNYWAETSSETIKKEVRPLLNKLILIDADLTTLRDKVTRDSVAVNQEINEIKAGLLNGKLLVYDPDPMPYVLLMTKISEINYGSEFAAARNERRSEDLTLRLAARERELVALLALDSILRIAMERNIDDEAKDYSAYIRDTYGSLEVVQSYLKSVKEYADNQRERTEREIAELRESIKWIVDGDDKIPAMPGVQPIDFYPVFIQEEAYTTGVLH